MTRTRTLLIGSGKVGTHLGRRLVASGGDVFALRRSVDDPPDGFSALAADLSRPLESQLPAVDEIVVTLPPGEDPRFLPHAIEHLARALPEVPARTVFVSSTRVFEGSDGDRPLDESDAPSPASARGEQLVAGERRAAELFGAVVLRPAGIYGPGRERLIRQVLAASPVDYDRRTNRIHETDLVRAIEALLSVDTPPAVLHGVDGRPATLGEVVTFIADRLGVPAPPHGEPDARRGTVLDGSRLRALVGSLEFPTFVEGYGRIIADRG